MMAQKLGLGVIAEGIEGKLQEQLLMEAGCSLGQGYLYCRPVTAQDLEVWVLDHKRQLHSNSSSKELNSTGQLPQRT